MKSVDLSNLFTRRGLLFFHPNAKGSGSAIHVDVASPTDWSFGALIITIAPQTESRKEDLRPRFDWDSDFFVHLDADETAQLLQVLRGIRENINYGKGIYSSDSCGHKILLAEHVNEPIPTVRVSISLRHQCDEDLSSVSFVLSESESLALEEVVSRAIYKMTIEE